MTPRLEITVRKYQALDKASIVKLMDKFGDYLSSIDHMKRQRKMSGFGRHFTEKFLKEIDRNAGVVYIAECKGQIAGFIAGAITRQTNEDLLESIPSKSARILELFIDEPFRGSHIGAELMERIEEDFRQAGCDVVRVEVFEPNINAHRFYRKLGYKDRSFDMIKRL